MNSKDPFSIYNIAGIRKEDKNRLLEAEICSVKDLVVRGPMNVSEATGIPISHCTQICSKAKSKLEQLGIINAPFTTSTKRN